MPSLILEQAIVDRLKSLEAGVELHDREGNLIGFFLPAVTSADVDQYECPVSEDELQRRASGPGGRPLTEILDDLEKRS